MPKKRPNPAPIPDDPTILAIDQGPTHSGAVLYRGDHRRIIAHDRAAPNELLFESLQKARKVSKAPLSTSMFIRAPFHTEQVKVDLIIFEMFSSYGSTVGRTTIDSIEWGGMIAGQAYSSGMHPDRVGWLANATWRNLCAGRPSATEKQTKQAIRDWLWEWYNDSNYPERQAQLGGGKDQLKGIQSNQGPLFGVADHVWSALGMATGYHRWATMARLAESVGHNPPPSPILTKTDMLYPIKR